MPTPPDFSVGQVLTAAQMDQIGLWRVTPASVAGSGVTLSGSIVNFTSSTSISVNSCFTSSFRHYKVLIVVGGAAAGGGNLQMKLRASGTDTSGNGYYWNGANQAVNNAPSSHSGVNVSYFYVSDVLNNVPNSAFVEATILNPQQNTRTGYIHCTHFEYGTDYFWRNVSGSTNFAGVYDGFTIASNNVALTGSLQIYGFNQG